MLSRLRSRLDAADPILKILGLSTLIGTLGRGVFLTVTVLYFYFVVGLSDAEISIVVGASSATGIVTSLVGGQLADRFSARRVLLAALAIESVGLVAYAFVGEFWMAVAAACSPSVPTAAHAARSAIIARGFRARCGSPPGPAPHHHECRHRRRIGARRARPVHRYPGGLPRDPDRCRRRLLRRGVADAPAARIRRRTDQAAAPPGDSSPIDGTSAAGAETDLAGAVHRRAPVSVGAFALARPAVSLSSLRSAALFAMQFGLLEFGVPLGSRRTPRLRR